MAHRWVWGAAWGSPSLEPWAPTPGNVMDGHSIIIPHTWIMAADVAEGFWQRMKENRNSAAPRYSPLNSLFSTAAVPAGQLVSAAWSGSRLSQSRRVPVPVSRIDGCQTDCAHSKPLNKSSESTLSHIQHMYKWDFFTLFTGFEVVVEYQHCCELSEDQRLLFTRLQCKQEQYSWH